MLATWDAPRLFAPCNAMPWKSRRPTTKERTSLWTVSFARSQELTEHLSASSWRRRFILDVEPRLLMTSESVLVD